MDHGEALETGLKKEDVPQESGILGRWRRLNYAVGEGGGYETVQSVGSEAVNVANGLAWELVRAREDEARERVKRGEESPLAFHMARAMMDAALAAQYTGISRRKVKKHLTPHGFSALTEEELARYAEVLELSVEDLLRLD